MTGYKSILNQAQLGRPPHVSKSLHSQRFQSCSKYSRVFSDSSGCFLKLSPVVCQSTRRSIMGRQCVHQSRPRQPSRQRYQMSDVQRVSLQMRKQLQCRCVTVPAVRSYNCLKHLMVLFPTSSSVEPRHSRRRERRPPGYLYHL